VIRRLTLGMAVPTGSPSFDHVVVELNAHFGAYTQSATEYVFSFAQKPTLRFFLNNAAVGEEPLDSLAVSRARWQLRGENHFCITIPMG
jgi:hypothetical protein